MTEPGAPVVAIFDFDGTLTRSDTLLPFLLFLAGPWRLAVGAASAAPSLVGYAAGMVRNDAAKERLLTFMLGGRTLSSVIETAQRFAVERIPGLLRPEAMARVRWHMDRGHRCIIASASLELYIRPWAIRAGFSDVLATRMGVDIADRLTGRFDGCNCYGAVKVKRMRTLLTSTTRHEIHAYGDSRGDRELLACADFAYYRRFPTEQEP